MINKEVKHLSKIDQKYLYLENSADLYYQSETYELLHIDFIKVISKFLIENKIRKLIALGCGNSFEEFRILSKIKKNIEYIGIDFSERMIELSEKTLTENKYSKFKLIHSDFFNKEIYFKSKEKKVYYSSGYTMCNLSSNDWISLLDNLSSGDFFVFYILSVDNPFIYKDIIAENIDNLCYNKTKITQYLKGLSLLGIKEDDGQFEQVIDIDEISVVIRYIFVLKNGKEIKVQEIRIYDTGKVIDLFNKSQFRLINSKEIQDTCLYFFQKI